MPRETAFRASINRTTPELLSKRRLGIFKPDNLTSELAAIASLHNSKSWHANGTGASTIGYFVGIDVALQLWQFQRRSHATTFSGVEELSLPERLQEGPSKVLLLGCAGIESYGLAQKTIARSLGLSATSLTTVDVSSFPLRRIRSANPDAVLVQSDAQRLPFVAESFDLVLSDLLFGGIDQDTTSDILGETGRVLRPGGQFIMRASVATDRAKDTAFGKTEAIGKSWMEFIHQSYGLDDATGRDKYLGLTPAQWIELGNLYGSFVLEHFFGGNRFTNVSEVFQTVSSAGFRVNQFVVKGELDRLRYVSLLGTK